jgi:hypothetical protein
MMGNRAMYHDGWIACCRHGRLPWETAGTFSYDDDKWELYNIAEDYSESLDLAEQEPAKLAELQDMFLVYNVPIRGPPERIAETPGGAGGRGFCLSGRRSFNGRQPATVLSGTGKRG